MTYDALAHTFGPWIQVFTVCFFTFLVGWFIGAAAFLGERKLLQTQKWVLWALPVPIFVVGFVYGILRFSGILLYAADGWDAVGGFDYTNQNSGAFAIYAFGCLLMGAIFAIYKNKKERPIKNDEKEVGTCKWEV